MGVAAKEIRKLLVKLKQKFSLQDNIKYAILFAKLLISKLASLGLKFNVEGKEKHYEDSTANQFANNFRGENRS